MEYLWRLGNRVYEAVAAVPGEVSRRMFRNILNELLGPYLKDKLQLEDLEARFGDGVFSFRDLVLEEEMVSRKLGSVRLTCRYACIGLLTVAAPYDLAKEDLRIEAHGATLVLSTSRDAELFRSAYSTSSSMMQSVMVGDAGEGDDDEDEQAPDVDANVFLELQENIADLLNTLKLELTDCRVIVEHAGHVWEMRLKEGSLFDTRQLDLYTIVAGDISMESISAKLGMELSLPPALFAVGETVRVPNGGVEGVTQRVTQKAVRFAGLSVNYYAASAEALERSGAGEELLEFLDRSEDIRTRVAQFEQDEPSVLFVELGDDKRVSLNVTLQSGESPFAVLLTQQVFRDAMALIEATTGDSDNDEDEEEGKSGEEARYYGGKSMLGKSQPNILSDYSMMYHRNKGSLVNPDGPLHFASALSDWTLLGTYAKTTMLKVSLVAPWLRLAFETPKRHCQVAMRDVKVTLLSLQQALQWSLEVDGGLSFTQEEAELITVFPAAMPLSVRGENVADVGKATLVAVVEHAPRIAYNSAALEAINDVVSMLQPISKPAQQQQEESRVAVRLEWKQLSVLVDGLHDVACSDASLALEFGVARRVRLEAGAAEVRCDGVEVVAATRLAVGVLWKSAASSTVPLIVNLSSIIPVPFEGTSMIWGADSTEVKLTQSFVATFPQIAARSDTHIDFLCHSLLVNLSHAQTDALLAHLQQPADTIESLTWGVAVREECLWSVTHESGARFDYCWSDMRTFGSTAQDRRDCNFLMLDAAKARIFVSNPLGNVPRALLWQKLSKNVPASNLDSLELTNLHTTLVCGRVMLTRVPSLRIVLRNCAISPLLSAWELAGDCWSGAPNSGSSAQPAEEEGVTWKCRAEGVAVLLQSRLAPTRSHAAMTVAALNIAYSSEGGAWQLSGDAEALAVMLSNCDTMPSPHLYLDRSAFGTSAYRTIVSLEGCNVGLMQDQSIAVNLVNFQERVLRVRTCADSLSAAIVLGHNWAQDAAELTAATSLFGKLRKRSEEEEHDGLMESSMIVSSMTDSAAAAGPPAEQLAPAVPALTVVRNASLEVHLFLLEVREEYKVGATVRVRWEYRHGSATSLDWVGMFKTTRSRGSKNYYAESLTGGQRFGVLEWKVPNKLGNVHFRFFRCAGMDSLVAVSESFRVGPLVHLKVTRVKNNYYVEKVVVKNDPAYGWQPKASDWIGLYAWNESNKNRPFMGAKKTVDSLSSVPFDVPSQPGRFVFRYFADMGWGQSSEIARSTPFVVAEHDVAQHGLIGRTPRDREPKRHWQVSHFHLQWSFVDGSDWISGETPAAGKRDEVMLEVVVPMATHSVMHSRAKHSEVMHVTCSQLRVHDRVACSQYQLLLSFPDNKRAPDAPCFQADLGRLQQSGGNRWECRADAAPLWLNVDQDTLIFVLRFGLQCHDLVCSELFLESDDPMEQSFVLMGEEEKGKNEEDEEGEAVFEALSVGAVDVEIDFRAKGRRMDTLLLHRRQGAEAVYRLLYYVSGLLSVNESHLTLQTVLLRDVLQSQVVAALGRLWFPQIQRDNVSSLLAGFEPVKFVFRVGDASISLVQGPLGELQKEGGSVLAGLAEGGTHLGKTVYVETFRGLSNLLVGAGNAFTEVDRIAAGRSSSTQTPPAQHVKAHSPADLREGLALAGRELAGGLGDAFSAVFYEPLATYSETGSATDAVVQGVRGLPGLVLKPLSALLRGGSIPLRAVAAAADPSIAQRAALKYKRLSKETKEMAVMGGATTGAAPPETERRDEL